MELPQEIMVWYVVPAIRKALVVELKGMGLKQKDIAGLLGLSAPAVSQYMKDKRATCCCTAFDKDPLKAEIKASADRIHRQERPDTAVAVREIDRLCRMVKESKAICDIHRQKDTSLKSCNICYDK
ncbi:transcriptional regulator [Candidatus Woesearchaeota archaeon]|nr:transcriptional regulator [Candidatus Woesearchaeota archaeon]